MTNEDVNNDLRLSPKDMKELGYRVIDMIVEHMESLQDKPIAKKTDFQILEKLRNESIPEHGNCHTHLLDQFESDILPNLTHADHPRFFGYIPGPNNFISIMADTLVSGLNIFSGASSMGPGVTNIELVTIDWLRQIYDFPEEAGGLFVSGGSMANLTGLAVARHIKLLDQTENTVIYTSDQTHLTIIRGLGILGFKSKQIKIIPTDKQFRIALPRLQQEVKKDRAEGKIPFCVIANAGTTNSGAIDPLQQIGEFCEKEGLWFHVDGAYGAPALLSEKSKSLLKGIELADSLVLDPHKWLFQPYEIGCVLVRDRKYLKDTFRITPDCLRDICKIEQEINFSEYGIQVTRSFRALKLWMSMKYFGIQTFQNAITTGITLAEFAEKKLRESSCWEIVTPAQIGIVTFRYIQLNYDTGTIDRLNEQIISEIIKEGYALLSSTVLDGKVVLRMCTINPRTTQNDIEKTILRLEKYGVELSKS
ncbi:pyridoxal phosphate-dependent decarboxylase family protein [Metabacillus bambusae]|uniref:Aminotransferase class V-fold PLP-dependent enzyme n=1 Tax=Metabacillus bambusae TaxID=2795218 RepID=A0ABS3N8W8_9BACI|nr:aminotransferase class V-fold PLP-dependent enzyme [Metabacillus bambusae]MBO1514358.1 aminotransferase class V-fold PLP-dependent enzyme [Metabacillus bambusae]